MNIFPYELEPESLRKVQIQFFNNTKSNVVKLSTYSTETKGLSRDHFVMQFPKIPNPKSIDRVRKKYPDSSLSDHLDILIENTNETTIFGQTRPKGDRGTYFKFCDCSLTEKDNVMELRLVVFGRVITMTFDKSMMDNPSDRDRSRFNFSIEGCDLDVVEDLSFHFDKLCNEETKKMSNEVTKKLSNEVMKKGRKGDSPPKIDIEYVAPEIDPIDEWISDNFQSIKHYYSKRKTKDLILLKMRKGSSFENAVDEIKKEVSWNV